MLRIPSAERLIASVKGLNLRTGDSAYKWEFTRSFMPALYRTHVSEMDKNCAFCENLVRTSCHRYCLKCRVGTYIHCCPLLPGMTFYYSARPGDSAAEPVPWYYKNPCPKFKRLDMRNYFRNFIIPLSSHTINNFEILEGLSRGISSGEKPCRICACVDYEIYKACSGLKDFDKTTPCNRIAGLMATRYCSLQVRSDH